MGNLLGPSKKAVEEERKRAYEAIDAAIAVNASLQDLLPKYLLDFGAAAFEDLRTEARESSNIVRIRGIRNRAVTWKRAIEKLGVDGRAMLAEERRSIKASQQFA